MKTKWQITKRQKFICLRLLILIAIAGFIFIHPPTKRWFRHKLRYYQYTLKRKKSKSPKKMTPSIKPQTTIISQSKLYSGSDWPQFRGPLRNGISPETNLFKNWPPKLIMTLNNIGKGYSSPVITKKYIIITGEISKQIYIFCFSIHGALIWHKSVSSYYKNNNYPGTRSTPTIDQNKLYHLSPQGNLTAHQLDTGKLLWKRNILKSFRAPIIDYGLAESPLIYKNKIICTPGGLDGEVIALDKNTGKTLWQSTGSNNIAGYGSPLFISHPKPQILITLHNTLLSVNPENGKQLWSYIKPFSYGRICMMPVISRNKVFIMGGELCGGGAIRLTQSIPIPLWTTPTSRSHFGGYITINNKIYGSSGKSWITLDFDTGKPLHKLSHPKNASTIYADNHFIALDQNGTIYLISQTPKILSKFKIPNPGRQIWSRPAISRARLYIRSKTQLHIYNLKQKQCQ